MKKFLRTVPFIVLAGVMMAGCAGEDGENGVAGATGPEGPAGPQGPQGLQGPAGENWQAWAYVGNNTNACYTCHSEKVTEWRTTGHFNSFQLLNDGVTDNSNNPYCLQCHTVGWDAPVAYGDTTITDHGQLSGGYDDFWPPADAADTARLHVLEGVQCESCHSSMGPGMYDHSPEITLATSPNEGQTAACTTCHDTQISQWTGGAHDFITRTNTTFDDFNLEWNPPNNPTRTCWECHGAQGFLSRFDPDYAGTHSGEQVLNQIGCATCHDPHNNGNAFQFRSVADVTPLYSPNSAITFAGRGSSQVCAQCHHGRRDATAVEGQVHGTSRVSGPHESPQMDMFLGTGCYEIAGATYVRESTHTGFGDPCVVCHMETSAPHGHDVKNHSFEPTLTACVGCHGTNPTSFDVDLGFGAGGGQTEVTNKLEQIRNFFINDTAGHPNAADSLDVATWQNLHMTTVEREAYYGYQFVEMDASRGVHNPRYTQSILNNAIDALNNQ